MLKQLQIMLSELYGIEQLHDVLDYVVTDRCFLSDVEAPETARDTEEKLLICQSGDELALSLYLAPELLERLEACDPCRQLDPGNFADFCTVLEGVSHFNYVAWNATADRSVTLHELEMQAEVDKYAGALAVLAGQRDSTLRDSLFECLFGAPVFADNLPPAERERYRSASAFAARFCRTLARRFPHGLSRPGMLGELRTFYRLSQPDKVSHIQSAVFA